MSLPRARGAGPGTAPARPRRGLEASAPPRARTRPGRAPGAAGLSPIPRGGRRRVQDLQQRPPTSSGCWWVCRTTRAHPGPSSALPVRATGWMAPRRRAGARCRGAATTARSRRKCDLPSRSSRGRPPLAVPDLEVERLHQPVSSTPVQTTARLPYGPLVQPNCHLLLARESPRWLGLLALPQPGLRRPGSAKPCHQLYSALIL